MPAGAHIKLNQRFKVRHCRPAVAHWNLPEFLWMVGYVESKAFAGPPAFATEVFCYPGPRAKYCKTSWLYNETRAQAKNVLSSANLNPCAQQQSTTNQPSNATNQPIHALTHPHRRPCHPLRDGLSHATFANRGTTPGGWDVILKENQGTVDQVSNIFYGTNGTSIKVTQTYTPGYTERYHSEVHRFQGYHRGEQGFYGLCLPAAAGLAVRAGTVVQPGPVHRQLHRHGLRQLDALEYGVNYRQPAGHPRGARAPYAIRPRETRSSSRTWPPSLPVLTQAVVRRGEGVGRRYNIATTVEETREFEFHVGLYANRWHDDHGMKGTQRLGSVATFHLGPPPLLRKIKNTHQRPDLRPVRYNGEKYPMS
ncbi:hypothetical protein B0H14DRAFT_3592490 [Mycena olivaceomarginata]|nr:hypothetical protein B0H14DRAFT_3592490 [Mycena olivaceomarginata]